MYRLILRSCLGQLKTGPEGKPASAGWGQSSAKSHSLLLSYPGGWSLLTHLSTMGCFVSIDSRNYWEWCLSFLESLLFVVCVCVCAPALKRQWVTARDVVQAWYGGEQQKELKKSPDTENLVILNVSMVSKGLDLHGGGWKDCHERKCRKSQAGYRMSQVVWVRRDLVLQDSDLRRKNQMIQHLSVAFCTHSSVDTPLHLFLSWCWMFLRRAWLTWLSDPKET